MASVHSGFSLSIISGSGFFIAFYYRCGSLERAKKRGKKAVVLPGYTVPPDHQGDENVTSGQSRRFLRASHSGLRIGNGSILLLSYCKGSRGFLWQRTY